MKIKGLTLEQIEAAAREAGHFKLVDVRSRGNYTFFVLRMASGTPGYKTKNGDRKFTRAEQLTAEIPYRMKYRMRGIGNVMHGRGAEYGVAVCFHGFKVFMEACFARNPQAIIRTARAAYLGLADFEVKHSRVGAGYVGAPMCPIQYWECCDC